MKNKNGFLIYTAIGTVVGAGIGMMAGKSICGKTNTLKKTAGKALRAAGSFIEHMSFWKIVYQIIYFIIFIR